MSTADDDMHDFLGIKPKPVVKSMLDEVAKALIKEIGSPWQWDVMPAAIKELWRAYAKSAILALRDPPDRMIEAGTKATDAYLNLEGSALTKKHIKMRLRFNRIIDEMTKDKQ